MNKVHVIYLKMGNYLKNCLQHRVEALLTSSSIQQPAFSRGYKTSTLNLVNTFSTAATFCGPIGMGGRYRERSRYSTFLY